jgi:hypothetical protein
VPALKDADAARRQFELSWDVIDELPGMLIKRPLLFTLLILSDCSCFGWVFKMFQLQNAIVAIVCNWTLKFTRSNGE